MADDDEFRIPLLEAHEEGEKRDFLLRGAGVCGLAKYIESAFVADAEGVAVVVSAVGSDL